MSLRSGTLLLSVGFGLLFETGSLRASVLSNAEKNVIAMSQAAFLASTMAGPLRLTGGAFSDAFWSFELTSADLLSSIVSGNFDPVTNHGTYARVLAQEIVM